MPAFVAHIAVMPHEQILDPQGKAVERGLAQMGLSGISQVRVGRQFRLTIDAPDQDQAKDLARQACERLLANPIMEFFHIDIEAMAPASVQ